jgi:SsrA-binding protein
LWLHRMYIGPYAQATAFGHEAKRARKLLAHRHEIEKLTGKLAVRGYTLVPLQVYFKNGRAKVELGLAKAKDIGDKRETLKREVELREAKESMSRGRR